MMLIIRIENCPDICFLFSHYRLVAGEAEQGAGGAITSP